MLKLTLNKEIKYSSYLTSYQNKIMLIDKTLNTVV